MGIPTLCKLYNGVCMLCFCDLSQQRKMRCCLLACTFTIWPTDHRTPCCPDRNPDSNWSDPDIGTCLYTCSNKHHDRTPLMLPCSVSFHPCSNDGRDQLLTNNRVVVWHIKKTHNWWLNKSCAFFQSLAIDLNHRRLLHHWK